MVLCRTPGCLSSLELRLVLPRAHDAHRKLWEHTAQGTRPRASAPGSPLWPRLSEGGGGHGQQLSCSELFQGKAPGKPTATSMQTQARGSLSIGSCPVASPLKPIRIFHTDVGQ